MNAPIDAAIDTGAIRERPSLVRRAMRGTGVSIAGQLAAQLLRLASNLMLTRLLEPESFGLMAIVSAVTQGLALVSDVGVWQAIVRSPRGDDRAFLDTAFTFHAIRGVGLFFIGCAAAVPAARFYGRDELLWLLPLCSLQSIISGLESTKNAQAARHMHVGRTMGVDLAQQTAALLVAIPVALITRSAVALVIASLVGASARTILTHVALPGARNRFFIEKAALSELFDFGRYVFVSTLFFFIGTRFDVFALGRLEGMGVVGVYGLATMIAQVPSQIGERVSYSVLMPALAERFRDGPAGFADDVLRSRKILLPAGAVLFLGAAVLAPPFFHLLYRDVYADAGVMVRFVVATSWCMFLQEASARALMALGDTKPLAIANAIRVVATVAFCFIGFRVAPHLSSAKLAPMFGFMIGNSIGAFVGVLAIDHGLRRHGARVALLDVGATIAFALALVVAGVIQR